MSCEDDHEINSLWPGALLEYGDLLQNWNSATSFEEATQVAAFESETEQHAVESTLKLESHK
jgi:hypothetical protein